MPNIKVRSNKQFEKIENKIDNFSSEAVAAVKNNLDNNASSLSEALAAVSVDAIKNAINSEAETLTDALSGAITEVASEIVPAGSGSGSLSGDLKDLIYGPDLIDGQSYEINFNAIDYTDILNSNFNFYLYDDESSQLYFGYNGCAYYSVHLAAYNSSNGEFYLQFDLSNPNKPAVWKKGGSQSSENYIDEELSNVTFKYYPSGIKSSYNNSEVQNFIKSLFLNEDGTEIDELIEGNIYKLNTNINDYRNLFSAGDGLYQSFGNSGSLYSWSAEDSFLRSIEVYGYYYNNTPYIRYNGNYYYLAPSINENTYPGVWKNNSSASSGTYYTTEELNKIYFTFNSNCVNKGYLQSLNYLKKIVHCDCSLEDKLSTITNLGNEVQNIKNITSSLKDATWETKWIDEITPVDGTTYSLPLTYTTFPGENVLDEQIIYGSLNDTVSIGITDEGINIFVNNINYYYDSYTASWYNYDTKDLISEPIELEYDSSKIVSDFEDLVFEIFGFNEHTENIKLSDAVIKSDESLKNKYYANNPSTCTMKSIPNWSDILNLSLGSFAEAYHGNNIGIGLQNNSGNLMVIFQYNIQDMFACTNYEFENGKKTVSPNTWYYVENGKFGMTFYDLDSPMPSNFEIDENAITNQTLLNLVADITPKNIVSLEQAINSILPPVDTTTDGTYVLEATVADGEVTYAWVLKNS